MRIKPKVSILITLLAIFTVLMTLPPTQAETGTFMWGFKMGSTEFPSLHVCGCPSFWPLQCGCVIFDKPIIKPRPSPSN